MKNIQQPTTAYNRAQRRIRMYVCNTRIYKKGIKEDASKNTRAHAEFPITLWSDADSVN